MVQVSLHIHLYFYRRVTYEQVMEKDAQQQVLDNETIHHTCHFKPTLTNPSDAVNTTSPDHRLTHNNTLQTYTQTIVPLSIN
jgi:hypothetical protein